MLTVLVPAIGPQTAGTFLVGARPESGYFTHDKDPGIGPMGYPDRTSALPFVCGQDPQHVARARWLPTSPLHYAASCTCGWAVEPSRDSLWQLLEHAAPAVR